MPCVFKDRNGQRLIFLYFHLRKRIHIPVNGQRHIQQWKHRQRPCTFSESKSRLDSRSYSYQIKQPDRRRFRRYMGCQHIVRRCRYNSSSSCRRSCRDNPVNHNRNMIDGTAQKSTCHRRQIESAYLLQYLHAIHGIRVMQSDSTPDCLCFPFQSSRI